MLLPGDSHGAVGGRVPLDVDAPFVLCGYIRSSFFPDEEQAAEDAQSSPSEREIQAAQQYVLNPRPGRDPGRDTPMAETDQLVIIAYERPKVTQYLLPLGA